METEECAAPSSLQFLAARLTHRGIPTAHVDQQTHEPAGHRSAAGVYKMGAVK